MCINSDWLGNNVNRDGDFSMTREELLERATTLPKVTEYNKWIEMEVKRHKPYDYSGTGIDDRCEDCEEEYPCELIRDIAKELK